jgi:hypothetical protein
MDADFFDRVHRRGGLCSVEESGRSLPRTIPHPVCRSMPPVEDGPPASMGFPADVSPVDGRERSRFRAIPTHDDKTVMNGAPGFLQQHRSVSRTSQVQPPGVVGVVAEGFAWVCVRRC